jgi:hypothetical protein
VHLRPAPDSIFAGDRLPGTRGVHIGFARRNSMAGPRERFRAPGCNG